MEFLAADTDSAARKELEGVTGIASSLIARESMRDSAIIVFGSGPRVRIYCLYGDDAITGDDAAEQALSTDVMSGNWHLSLPCPAEDLDWVQSALKKKGTKISARDLSSDVDGESDQDSKSAGLRVNREAFFRS
jgi:hypothetical protein